MEFYNTPAAHFGPHLSAPPLSTFPLSLRGKPPDGYVWEGRETGSVFAQTRTTNVATDRYQMLPEFQTGVISPAIDRLPVPPSSTPHSTNCEAIWLTTDRSCQSNECARIVFHSPSTTSTKPSYTTCAPSTAAYTYSKELGSSRRRH